MRGTAHLISALAVLTLGALVAAAASDRAPATTGEVTDQEQEQSQHYLGAEQPDAPRGDARGRGREPFGRACLTPPDFDAVLAPTTAWQVAGPISLPSNDCYIFKVYMEPGFGYDFSCCINDAVGGDSDNDADFELFSVPADPNLPPQSLWYLDGASACGYNASTLGTVYQLWEPPVAGDYYLKVDDWNTEAITFSLAYKLFDFASCDLVCPPGAVSSCDPVCYPDYEDIYNGGCNIDPAAFQDIACGDTVCGTYGVHTLGTNTLRDMDWYHVEVTEPSILTADVVGECDIAVWIAGGACPAEVITSAGALVPCTPVSVSTPTHVPPGIYTIIVAPFDWNGCACGSEYHLTVACAPVTLGACCDVVGLCAEMTAADCASVGGAYQGDNTTCDAAACPSCVNCSPTATPENEPDCGLAGFDTVNGGCNALPPVFSPLTCGEAICGTVEAVDGVRDTDWYEVTTTSWSTMTWAAEGQFPIVIGLAEQLEPGVPGCDNTTGYIAPYAAGNACQPVSITTECLPPGTYYFFVAPSVFEDVPCGATYAATLTCTACAPTYCAASASACDEWIGNVSLADIDNASSCDNYADFTSLSATLERGGTYPMTVTNGGTPYPQDTVTVWIDWDQDTNFTAGEQTSLTSDGTGAVFTGDIVVPSDALLGTTRMRVRMEYGTTSGACGVTDWGDVEDYATTVVQQPALTLEPAQDCYRAGDTVLVGVWMRGVTEQVSGGQFFMSYDDAALALDLTDPNDAITPGDAPMTRQVFECSLDEQTGACGGAVAGEIGYAVGAANQGDFVTGDHRLALIRFTALVDICDIAGLVEWRTNDPPTRLTAVPFGVVLPTLKDSAAVDTTPPTFTVFPANHLVECNSDIAAPDVGLVTAVDNCDDAVVITHAGDTVTGSGSVVDPYVVERVYRATDHCGNFTERTQLIVAVDTQPPTVDCPPDIVIECDDPFDPNATGMPVVSDNCSLPITLTYFDDTTCYGCGGTGEILRTWTATDAAGNSASCTQVITVDDTTPPTITCPADIGPVNADPGSCEAVLDLPAVVVFDNCDPAPIVSYLIGGTPISSPYTFPAGTTTVTVKAVDECANESTCTFDVEVLAFNDLVVTVEIEGDVAPLSFTRCITLSFVDSCGNPAIVIERDMTFSRDANPGSPTFGFAIGTATLTLADGVPCSSSVYTCVTAQDVHHTLTRAITPMIASGAYALDFTLAKGAHLLQGDYYDDVTIDGFPTDYIDILDFGVWFNEYGATYDANTPCGYAAPWHTNANAYGQTDVGNYSYIADHFLVVGEQCCPTRATVQPRRSITVAELLAKGLHELVPLDVNGDDVFDMRDVNRLINGGPDPDNGPARVRPLSPSGIGTAELQRL